MGAPGDMPPNSSSDEDESDSDDGDIQPHGAVQAEAPRRRKKDDDEDPAQVCNTVYAFRCSGRMSDCIVHRSPVLCR